MWTEKNRPKYNRDKLRYPSDVTDEEWALVEPLIPCEKRGGRHREVDMRAVFNGVMYVLSTGCQWRYIPKDLPPKSTVYRYFCDWGYDGTLDRIHAALYARCREQAERESGPTLGIIDSQSVKGAEKGEAALRKDPRLTAYGRQVWASGQRGARGLIRMAMMRARKSKARNGIFSSIRSGRSTRGRSSAIIAAY